MVRQAMISNVEALLAFFAKKSQGFEQLRTHLTVIPAKACTRGEQRDVLGFEERGIPCKYAVRSTQHKNGCVLRTHVQLDSGLRRNDVRFDLALRSAA